MIGFADSMYNDLNERMIGYFVSNTSLCWSGWKTEK